MNRRHHRSLHSAFSVFLRWAVILLSAGYTFLDYWGYNRMFRDDPREYADLLAGRGSAPAQYRIGVLRVADAFAHVAHAKLRHGFALIDFVCLLAGLGAVVVLLTRSRFFRRASRETQWASLFLFFSVFELYLFWTFWFQKPETMATFAFLALSALVTSSHAHLPPALRSLILIVLALAQATVRADAAVAFHLGMLAVCLWPGVTGIPMGRVLQAATSAASAVAAVAVQYGIAHWVYPQAQRNVGALQLLGNLHSANGYASIVLALTPWWVTLWLAYRRWRKAGRWKSRPWAIGLLLGSAIHFAMFYTVGMAEEVRIFLPYAMAVLPVTVPLFSRVLMPMHREPPTTSDLGNKAH